MSTMAPGTSKSSKPNNQKPIVQRPNLVAVGTIVWLASEVMFFAGLFAIYFTLRSTRPNEWAESSELLNIPYALTNTLILVLSSVACQFGVFSAERMQAKRTGSLLNFKNWGMVEWFVLTYIMGSVFIAGQVGEYAQLYSEGLSMSSNAYGSAFYLTTGFHGLHVLGGLMAFLFVIGRAFMARKFGHREATSAVVVSYYWHFVDIVWICLFIIIYVIK